MDIFLESWANAAHTSVGFFWMALWAFILGYAVSGMIQVFITQERMQKVMGESGLKTVGLGTFFGFISSSCSFSALASAKSLFQKGASFSSAIAFLLSSTNLVIELGIIISIFLGWQFVVGEYIGGLILILVSWILIKIIKPTSLIKKARKNIGEKSEDEVNDESITDKMVSSESWAKVGKQYGMEWKMVWKDVTVGFTIAGIISAFVPDSFFETLFINTGSSTTDFSFLTLLQHVIIGPVAAFCTFIGSMGNIPLAALLFSKNVSFAGVMAFIFSDLVVFPVLRINAKYYGWKMSFFIVFLLFSSLVVTSLILHYGFDLMALLPDFKGATISDGSHFKVDYTFWLNVAFLIISAGLVYQGFFKGKNIHHHKEMAPKSPLLERVLKYLAFICYGWLITGLVLKFIIL